MSPRKGPIAIAIGLLAVACQEPPQDALAPAADTVAVRRFVEAPAGPEPSGPAIGAWLREARYRETWMPWPDTSLLRPDSVQLAADTATQLQDTLPGAENAPHGALPATYLNPIAVDALERGAEAMPPGAIAVIEEHLADSTLAGIGVMVQSEGYDPENRDWVFARFGSAWETEAIGRVEACQGCHVLEPDYLFGAELGAPLPIDSTGASPDTTASR